jgi:hypothetical protein
VDDDPQPGIVAGEFMDANGVQHTIIDKVFVITDAMLAAQSTYPQPGSAPCEILAEFQDVQKRDVARITIWKPALLESVDGEKEFVVLASEISES